MNFENFFNNIIFEDKIFFFLFLIIPVIIYFYFNKKGEENFSIKVSFFSDAKKFFGPKTFSEKIFYFLKKNFSIILKILILIFLIFIIAKPQSQNISVERKYFGIDVVLAVDVSLSMLAEDMEPNRITVAKNTILDFIDGLRLGDRMSLVVFSGRPFTNIPLTGDLNSLKDFTRFLSTDLINQNVIGLNGTGIGDALLYSIDKFDKFNKFDKNSKGELKNQKNLKNKENREKIIILMTDGESNRGISLQLPTKLANNENIKVYTIGIGKKEGAVIPIILQNGSRSFINNPDGTKFLTSLDEHSMIQIAQKTGGKYFHSDKKDSLEKIFKEIYDLEKKEIIFENKKTVKEEFFYFAIFAFLFFCLEFVLSFFFLRKKV